MMSIKYFMIILISGVNVDTIKPDCCIPGYTFSRNNKFLIQDTIRRYYV